MQLYDGERLIGSVMVLAATHGIAKLGFEMESEIRIVRDEIDEREKGKEAAAA